jgi:hypothetical protein
MDGLLAISEIIHNLIAHGDRDSIRFFKETVLKARLENNQKTCQMLEYVLELARTLKNATDILVEHSLHDVSQTFQTVSTS